MTIWYAVHNKPQRERRVDALLLALAGVTMLRNAKP
jgi:hypothetical protein